MDLRQNPFPMRDPMTQSAIPWQHLSEPSRKRLIWWLWLLTWFLLLAGLLYPYFYKGVVLLSALHALLFLWLFRFRVDPFPVQVRLAYLFWVSIGTFVPGMIILMYITTVGLAANLFLNYCPLARLMHLMPWNRTESLSLEFLKRVFLSPPSQGRFIPRKNG